MEEITETKNMTELDTKNFDDLQEQMTVVDFKTDAYEDPGRHASQLAVYRRAVSLMRNKDFSLVRTYVYYLRSGHTADLTAQTAKLKIDLSAALFEPYSSLSGIL